VRPSRPDRRPGPRYGECVAEPAVVVRGMRVGYGKFVVLDDVDLTVAEGEIVVSEIPADAVGIAVPQPASKAHRSPIALSFIANETVRVRRRLRNAREAVPVRSPRDRSTTLAAMTHLRG